MDLVADTTKRRADAWPWRFVCTALSFALFGVGGLVLRLLILPVVMHWPAPLAVRRRRGGGPVGRAVWVD
jgi:hypothetical protein